MARRIVEFLNSHGQPRLAEPFLVTLEALDRNGPLPVGAAAPAAAGI